MNETIENAHHFQLLELLGKKIQDTPSSKAFQGADGSQAHHEVAAAQGVAVHVAGPHDAIQVQNHRLGAESPGAEAEVVRSHGELGH